jgi:hypothetical protein
VKDQPYGTIDDLIAEIQGMTIEEIASEPFEGTGLISVDRLLAAGALDCPPEWRKSLSAGTKKKRERGLFDDEDEPGGAEQTPSGDAERDGLAGDESVTP